eukprot:6498887-Lingulodinium_polyedra.AAC.1
MTALESEVGNPNTGYNSYKLTTTLWRLLSHKHLTFRTLADHTCRRYPWRTVNRVVRFVPAKKKK